MDRRPKDFSYLNDLKEDALKRIRELAKLEENINYYSWPQMWGSATCGHNGIGAQVMTLAQVDVFFDPYNGIYVVYSGGIHLYTVDFRKIKQEEKKEFMNCLNKKHMVCQYAGVGGRKFSIVESTVE